MSDARAKNPGATLAIWALCSALAAVVFAWLIGGWFAYAGVALAVVSAPLALLAARAGAQSSRPQTLALQGVLLLAAVAVFGAVTQFV